MLVLPPAAEEKSVVESRFEEIAKGLLAPYVLEKPLDSCYRMSFSSVVDILRILKSYFLLDLNLVDRVPVP